MDVFLDDPFGTDASKVLVRGRSPIRQARFGGLPFLTIGAGIVDKFVIDRERLARRPLPLRKAFRVLGRFHVGDRRFARRLALLGRNAGLSR